MRFTISLILIHCYAWQMPLFKTRWTSCNRYLLENSTAVTCQTYITCNTNQPHTPRSPLQVSAGGELQIRGVRWAHHGRHWGGPQHSQGAETQESQTTRSYNTSSFIFSSVLCPRHSKNGGGALSVTSVRACVCPSVIKIWCPLSNFWKTASIQFKFGTLINNIKTQVEFDLGYNPLIFDGVMGLL